MKDKYEGNATHRLYNRYFEYSRVCSEVQVTAEGVFKKGETPDEYAGLTLDIEACHAVYLVNTEAEVIILEFEVPEAMDKDRKLGGPIMRDGKEIKEQTGDSAVPTEQTTRENANLDDRRKQLGKFAVARFDSDKALVEPPAP